jgi:hypothetical protein
MLAEDSNIQDVGTAREERAGVWVECADVPLCFDGHLAQGESLEP